MEKTSGCNVFNIPVNNNWLSMVFFPAVFKMN